IAAERPVGSDDDIVFLECLLVARPVPAVVDMIGQRGSEFAYFVLPVEHQRGGTNYERVQSSVLVFEMVQEGQRLDRLTQTHVIGQDAAPVDFLQIVEPVKAMRLIGSQDGGQV